MCQSSRGYLLLGITILFAQLSIDTAILKAESVLVHEESHEHEEREPNEEKRLLRAFQHNADYWNPNYQRAQQETTTLSSIESAQAELAAEQEKIEKLKADILLLQTQVEEKKAEDEATEEINGFQPGSDHDRTMVLVPASAVSGFIPGENEHKAKILLSTLLYGLAAGAATYIAKADLTGWKRNKQVALWALGGLSVGALINGLIINSINKREDAKVRDFFLNKIESLQTTPILQIDEDEESSETKPPVKRRVKILPQQIYNCLMVAAEKYKSGEWSLSDLKKYAFDFRKSSSLRP